MNAPGKFRAASNVYEYTVTSLEAVTITIEDEIRKGVNLTGNAHDDTTETGSMDYAKVHDFSTTTIGDKQTAKSGTST